MQKDVKNSRDVTEKKETPKTSPRNYPGREFLKNSPKPRRSFPLRFFFFRRIYRNFYIFTRGGKKKKQELEKRETVNVTTIGLRCAVLPLTFDFYFSLSFPRTHTLSLSLSPSLTLCLPSRGTLFSPFYVEPFELQRPPVGIALSTLPSSLLFTFGTLYVAMNKGARFSHGLASNRLDSSDLPWNRRILFVLRRYIRYDFAPVKIHSPRIYVIYEYVNFAFASSREARRFLILRRDFKKRTDV